MSDGMFEMWDAFSINSVSARAKAFFGKLFGAADDDCEEDDCEQSGRMLGAGESLPSQEYESVTVETEDSEPVRIFTSRPSEAAYFEESEEYVPTIVGTPAVDISDESIVEVRKKEKVNVSEAADLFMNAYVRPARKSFDATPVYKKKAVVSVPAQEIQVEQPVESIVIEAPSAGETFTVQDEAPAAVSIPAAEETVAEVLPESIVIEAPSAEEAETVEAESEAVELPAFDIDAVIASYAHEEVAASATEAEDVELPAFDFAAIEAYSEPAPAVEAEPEIQAPAASIPAVEETDSTVFENFESDESRIECEIAHGASESYESLVRLEEPETIVAEPAAESTPAQVSAPIMVIPAAPKKIEVPALDKAEPAEEPAVVISSGSMEVAQTSAEAMAEPVQETVTVECAKEELKPVVKNEDRDLMMIFRPELEADEAEFVSTSVDDNLAFREDELDRTERVFNIRNFMAPRFNGNLRSIGFY